MRSREKIVADTQRCMTFVEPARTPALLAGVIELLTDLRDQNERIIALLTELADQSVPLPPMPCTKYHPNDDPGVCDG